jgi:hypothetical protein
MLLEKYIKIIVYVINWKYLKSNLKNSIWTNISKIWNMGIDVCVMYKNQI